MANGYTTVRRVVDIPEIVERILSFVDEKAVSGCMMVCRRWFDIALNRLWRTMIHPRPLFCLLAPMASVITVGPQSGHQFWTFTRTPGVEDWARFNLYARRVRSLTLDEQTTYEVISKDVFDEISRSRVSLNILPNLHTLTWLTTSVERMRLSLLFQHENISHFSIYLHKTESYPLSTFLKEVLLRMPNVVDLDLHFKFPAREVESELIDALSGLTKLQRVIMPAYTFTTRIMEALSKHSDLDTIQFEFMDSQGHGDLEDVVSWAPTLEEGAFPSLWDLSISCTLQDMTRFLTAEFGPKELTSLYIHILSSPPLEAVVEFLQALSRHCKNIMHLYLDFLTSASIEPTPQTWPRLNWASLRPLLSCQRLVSFELRWDHPLELTLDDIKEIASSLPQIEVLHLNCEPMGNLTPPTIGLDALLPFARHCPKLQELGLYLSASEHTLDSLHNDEDIKPFQSLRRLNVGLSPIDKPDQVALYLSKSCPLECQLFSGMSWPEGFAIIELPDNMHDLNRLAMQLNDWHKNWNEVAKLLPLLTKLRQEERATRQALEREVEDLRIRCRLMTEKANIPIDPDGSCTPF